MEFKRYITFIKFDSPKNALKVKKEVIAKVASIKRNPERFTPDKFKINNDGSVRYFELYSLRISFEIVDEEYIDIIRCRHTSRKPDEF
jgi:plasmid stabilization system protein ParE